MVSPALDEVARDLAGRVKLVKVDVDAAPAVSQRFAVQAVPALMVLRDREVIALQSGAPAPAIRRWVQDAVEVGDSDT
jgi:thioredoxin 2